MANTHDIRRLAFQALYQLDARPDDAAREVLDAMATDLDDGSVGGVGGGGGGGGGGGDAQPFAPAERRKAMDLAIRAYEQRATADAFLVETAPTWPTHRQAAVDRAILRLAYFEMTTHLAPPKVVIDEAVELAKMFSTDKSSSFVNGVLDKLMKTLEASASGPAPETPSVTIVPAADVTPEAT